MSEQDICPWIMSLILRLRPDLCKLFPERNASNRLEFLSWLVTSGTREYQSLIEDDDLRAFLSEIDSQTQLKRLLALVYATRPDVQAVYPLAEGINAIEGWFERHGIAEHGLAPFLQKQKKRYQSFNQRKWGVNLIGYVYGQLGIGEDLRMAARALQSAKIPFTLLNFAPGKEIPQNDHSMAAYVSKTGEYAYNLFCMTALEHGRYYAERGKTQIQGRYNIGYWPWELSQWPTEWQDLTRLVNEVWVSTQHTYDALAAVSDVPVFIMPMAVELGEVTKFSSQILARQHYCLPVTAKLFCFSFDLNSSIHRKNPQACVDAFLQAFPMDEFSKDQVGLVIKVHKPAKRHAIWEKLKALAKADKRIHIIEITLSRPDLLLLYQSCDCFVSLHRAEGFGRGIAEALQLGLHVITTGYSGNVDFCKSSAQVNLVRYQLVKIKKNQYPYGKGQLWADVDINHAAELMRNFVTNPIQIGTVFENNWPQFSAQEIGLRYRSRLHCIEKMVTRRSD
ncbi:glycosyltransferase [Crenothrix polyspora]|nr:glycosyltransferase [Crenothrix polyspora]